MTHVYDLSGVVPGKTRIAFGSFDGMHIGHQAIIEKVCSHEGETPIIVTFAEEEAPIIYSENEKEYLLQDSKVEVMVSMKAPADAEAFAKEVLVDKLHAKTVVMGADHPELDAYKAYGEKYGFAVETVPTVCYEGEVVSADAIKACITGMDFPKMRELLGRTYIMQGVVVHGKAAGRKHGMPTANLGVAKNKLFPPHGVYGTLSLLDGVAYRGMTNIGLRPSDDDIPIATIETHILNFAQDIYDKTINLEVFIYVRGVKKFAGGLDEVRKQIDKDLTEIREYMDTVMSANPNVR